MAREPTEDDRRAGARRALAAILAEYLGGAAGTAGRTEVELRVDEDGKPRLAVAPERLSFNLSHSGDLALVAIAPGGVEVGVDLERLRPRRDLVRLAERRLPPADATAVAVASPGPEREAAFYAAWTRHEARVKCVGSGLFGTAPRSRRRRGPAAGSTRATPPRWPSLPRRRSAGSRASRSAPGFRGYARIAWIPPPRKATRPVPGAPDPLP